MPQQPETGKPRQTPAPKPRKKREPVREFLTSGARSVNEHLVDGPDDHDEALD